MKALRYYRLLVVVLSLAGAQTGGSADSFSSEAEANPIEPGQILRDRAKKQTRANQENNRVWVAIPNAVGEDVERAPTAVLPVLAPPPPPSFFEEHTDHIRLGLALAFVVALVSRVIIRHRSEAEIRALSGGYLSDGTEVARFQMPELFAPPPPPASVPAAKSIRSPRVSDDREAFERDSTAEFFREAPKQVATIREMLDQLLNSTNFEEGETILWKLHGVVLDLQQKADCRKLRPAWQMTSALELFVRRVAEKPKDATPSVIRTVDSAIDVLCELCVPGIRPDLISEPPLKILAVDDDALCRRAVQYALQKAHLTPDLASDGEQAVALASTNAYDVVFMDIMMPRMDGFTACTRIHETEKNAQVPVIFVTALSDFETRSQSRLKGGSDLIAKPYLVLELTVKAVTYAIRGRLQSSRETAGEAAGQSSNRASVAESPVAASFASTAAANLNPRKEAGSLNTSELRGDFFAELPAYLAATRKLVEELRAADPADVQERLDALYLRVHAIAAKSGLAGLQIAARVGCALEALLNKLYVNPKAINASTLNTVDNALQLLGGVCVRGIDQKLGNTPVRLLIADDEPLARRAIVGALQLAFDKPESVENGASACVAAAQTVYDVIFTDVQMPVMDGFAFCKDIRAGKTNRQTPVVFVTGHTDAASQTQAFESGANDFIGKPFLPIEITVKALTFAWEGRLRKLNEPQDSTSTDNSPVSSSAAANKSTATNKTDVVLAEVK